MATKIGLILFGLCLVVFVSTMLFAGGEEGAESPPKAVEPPGKKPDGRTSQTRKVEELGRKLDSVRLEKSVAATEVETATLEVSNAETRVQQAQLPVQQAESDLVLAQRLYDSENAVWMMRTSRAQALAGEAAASGYQMPPVGPPPNEHGLMQARERLNQVRQRCELEISNAQRGKFQASNRLAQAQQRHKKAENDEGLILLEIEKVSHGD